MARNTDREPFLNGQRFFFRSIGGLGLPPGGAEAGGHASGSEGSVSSGYERVVSTPAVNDHTSRLSERVLHIVV